MYFLTLLAMFVCVGCQKQDDAVFTKETKSEHLLLAVPSVENETPQK